MSLLTGGDGDGVTLKRTLGPLELVALGIGAIIGAGLFSLTGIVASTYAGPAVTLSFILAAIACGLAGLCYAEMTGMIPKAGSAYSYAYATMGEFVAWIIGWELVLEYAFGAGTVSVSWSRYVVKLLHDFGVVVPPQLTVSPFDLVTLADGTQVHGLANLPALLIIVLISLLLMRGIQESARVTSAIVVIKVAVVLIVIGVGVFYIKPENYVPFIPPNTGQFGEFGWSGVVHGAGAIFFAYIGFDAVSTAAQEAKNPGRTVPIGILGSLAICTLIYIAFALVLTGMVNYQTLKGDAAPVATAISLTPFKWLAVVVELGAIAGLTTVILVMLLGQSRVFYAMAEDGLLPKVFCRLHPTWCTPYLSNAIFMVFTGIIGTFVPIRLLGELTSIGTLLAFVIVCVGVIILRRTNPNTPRSFRTPFVPVVPIAGVAVCGALMYGLDARTWKVMFCWLILGLLIFFAYSRGHSRLGTAVAPA